MMEKIEIENYEFKDRDVKVGFVSCEFGILFHNNHTCVRLTKTDVEALAKHFGLIGDSGEV